MHPDDKVTLIGLAIIIGGMMVAPILIVALLKWHALDLERIKAESLCVSSTTPNPTAH